MASVSTEKRTGLRRVLFYDSRGHRQSIRLGRVPLKTARDVAAHVAHLVSCGETGDVPRRSTVEWLNDLHSRWPALRTRIGQLNLYRDGIRSSQSFAEFAEAIVSERTDLKPNTLRLRVSSIAKLREFFGSKLLSSLTTKDGSDYLRWLSNDEHRGGAGLSASTPSKHFEIAKGILREAVDAGILPSNPFQRLRGEKPINRARQQFIAPDSVKKVMATVQNLEFRAVVALSRWGGLRIPSEAFSLQWKHIDWIRQRLNVPAVKTKARAVPLFPELSFSLTELWQSLPSPTADDFVVPSLRAMSDSNLRKMMTTAVRSAGLSIWPKIFHNLRASRQTELEERFPGRPSANGWATARPSPTTITSKYSRNISIEPSLAKVG